MSPATQRAVEGALAANDIARAARIAAAALARGELAPMLLNLAAWQQEEAGDFAAARALLARALALSPEDPAILGGLGAVLRKERRPDEALAVVDRAIARAPHHAAAWLERGYVLDDLGRAREAAAAYARAIELDGGMAPAMARLAAGAAKRGDAAAGRGWAARALAIAPAEPTALAALAEMEIEAGEAATAAARLEALTAGPLAGDDRTRALTLLGDAYDRLDRPADAFAEWGAAQANFRTVYAAMLAPVAGRPSHRAFIERIATQVEATPPLAPPPPRRPVPGAAATHVFLLGYPRSGTTLVENILASAPGVIAVEERDTLADADAALVANDGTMPPLDALDPALVASLRERYWRRAARWAGTDLAGTTFVDMNPFNGIKLPVIARLFPDARILLMRRDPRDVVLSCFRINFTPSPAAWAFSELDEAARHYDALMRLIELCRARLPLAVHEVRYDRLVADFEPTVRTLAAFVGLGWTDAFARFDRTAQARGVRTASATQVRRGLYDGGGRWRRYATELAPVLPILAPWVARFGLPE